MQTKSEISTAVAKIVGNQLNIDSNAIHESAEFYDLGADSLDVVEILMAIENHYEFDLPNEVMESCNSIKTYTDFIEQELRKRH
jgi:acyl carrier protein